MTHDWLSQAGIQQIPLDSALRIRYERAGDDDDDADNDDGG